VDTKNAPGGPLLPAADAAEWKTFPDHLPAEEPLPRDPASRAALASPACAYSPASPASIHDVMANCFPRLNIDHVMRDGRGNACAIPSQIGGRCYCPTEVATDECKDIVVPMDYACRMLFMVAAITQGPIVEFGRLVG
jgi:hypothetical protein